jgi:hypothetical protein
MGYASQVGPELPGKPRDPAFRLFKSPTSPRCAGREFRQSGFLESIQDAGVGDLVPSERRCREALRQPFGVHVFRPIKAFRLFECAIEERCSKAVPEG